MINKLISSTKLIYISWLLFLSYPLLSFLRYQLFILNNYRFVFGELFWKVLLWLPYITGITSIVILMKWVIQRIKTELLECQIKAIKFVVLSSILYFIFGRLLIFIENSNYSNFIYTNTGIDVGRLDLSTSIAWFVVITVLAIDIVMKNQLSKMIGLKADKTYKSKIILFALAYSSLIILTLSIYSLFNSNVYYQISNSKYEQKYGDQISYLESLKKVVPSNGYVIHPPRNLKWAAVGNQSVVRYFLFPRVLIDGYLVNNQKYVNQFGEVYFQEIELNNELTHWPSIDDVKQQIVFNEVDPIRYKQLIKLYDDGYSRIYLVKFK